MHTLLDLRGNIPAFIHISNGKLGDVKILDILAVEPGAFYIMDRAYVDFARLYTSHQKAGFFVTRSKTGMSYKRLYSNPVGSPTGIICDQIIKLTGIGTSTGYPERLRRIRFKDPSSKKTLIFITNNMILPAPIIAEMYKNRWQIELFFKWIKQNLRIRHFLGTSENAVKAQIWCAVSTYVLIAIVKKELSLEVSLYTLLQVLSVSVFEKIDLAYVLKPVSGRSTNTYQNNQLNLFEI
jgi:hypothetical protein